MSSIESLLFILAAIFVIILVAVCANLSHIANTLKEISRNIYWLRENKEDE